MKSATAPTTSPARAEGHRGRKTPRPWWKPSWRTGRRIVQIACLAAFLWLFRRTEYDGFREIPSAASMLFRLDPLVGASTMLAAREVILSLLVPALLVLILTFVFGRFFCGWICPLGTLLDVARRGARPFRRRTRPGAVVAGQGDPSIGAGEGRPAPKASFAPRTGWRRVKFYLLAAVLVGAVLGLPLVGYVDPFSILLRGMAFAVDPLASDAVAVPFDWLYRNAPRGVTDVSEGVYADLKGSLLPLRAHPFLLGGMSFVLLATVFLLELRGRRFWCRGLCPVGALLSVPARWSLLRRKPFRACKGCRECAEGCRMEAFDAEGRMSPEDCNLCMDCEATCPHGTATFRFGRTRVAAAPFDPTRRALLGAAGFGLVLSVAARLEGKSSTAAGPRPLRPPGAPEDEGEFLDRCVRCGLCMKVCPTGGLQPAGLEGSWQGLFSPRLVPRMGYCEYNCTLCGELCPTGALPRLTEAEKHEAIIGKAQFDRDRCLPYARGEPCIVCEEHCPTPEKAIQVREREATKPNGEKVTLLEPYVVLERCVGCGICEQKCPRQGAAGIRVLHVKEAAITEEMAQMEDLGELGQGGY